MAAAGACFCPTLNVVEAWCVAYPSLPAPPENPERVWNGFADAATRITQVSAERGVKLIGPDGRIRRARSGSGAARALKRDHEIGSLQIGRRADLVLVSRDQLRDMAAPGQPPDMSCIAELPPLSFATNVHANAGVPRLMARVAPPWSVSPQARLTPCVVAGAFGPGLRWIRRGKVDARFGMDLLVGPASDWRSSDAAPSFVDGAALSMAAAYPRARWRPTSPIRLAHKPTR